MKNTDNATKRPWMQGIKDKYGRTMILNKEHMPVVIVEAHCDEENIKHIVKCVNNFDGLVEALKRCEFIIHSATFENEIKPRILPIIEQALKSIESEE